jgi:hypothetical protein
MQKLGLRVTGIGGFSTSHRQRRVDMGSQTRLIRLYMESPNNVISPLKILLLERIHAAVTHRPYYDSVQNSKVKAFVIFNDGGC